MSFPAFDDPGALRCPAGHVELVRMWSNSTDICVWCDDCEDIHILSNEDT